MPTMTGCDCIVCVELNTFHSTTGIDDLVDLMKMAVALSPEVKEILIAQNRVRDGTAGDHDKVIVSEAAKRCKATALFRKVGELAPEVIDG